MKWYHPHIIKDFFTSCVIRPGIQPGSVPETPGQDGDAHGSITIGIDAYIDGAGLRSEKLKG